MDLVFVWMVAIGLIFVFGQKLRGFSVGIDSPAFCGWLKSTCFLCAGRK